MLRKEVELSLLDKLFPACRKPRWKQTIQRWLIMIRAEEGCTTLDDHDHVSIHICFWQLHKNDSVCFVYSVWMCLPGGCYWETICTLNQVITLFSFVTKYSTYFIRWYSRTFSEAFLSIGLLYTPVKFWNGWFRSDLYLAKFGGQKMNILL